MKRLLPALLLALAACTDRDSADRNVRTVITPAKFAPASEPNFAGPQPEKK